MSFLAEMLVAASRVARAS